MKNKKAAKSVKPGSGEELAKMFLPVRAIDVQVRRFEGEGKDAKLHLDAETVFVREFSIVEAAAVIRALMPIGAAGFNMNNVELLAHFPVEVCNAVAAAIGWAAEKVARIRPGDFGTVYFAVLEANEDFSTRLAGLLVPGGAPDTTAMAGNGAGRTPSSSLRQPPDAAIPSNSH